MSRPVPAKMSRRMKETENVKLVRLYREHECLWNVKSKDYKNKEIRQEALRHISHEMDIGLHAGEIKNKIKTIRATYYLELDKIQKSMDEGGKVYTPTVKWFDAMDSFIRDVAINRKTPLGPRKKLYGIKPKTEEASDDNNRSTTVATSTPRIAGDFHCCRTERKRYLNACVSEVCGAIKKLKETSESRQQDENEFDIFCDSLAIQLKRMPLNRALICQEKLQGVMTQERLCQLSQSRPPKSSSSSENTPILAINECDMPSPKSSPTHSIQQMEPF